MKEDKKDKMSLPAFSAFRRKKQLEDKERKEKRKGSQVDRTYEPPRKSTYFENRQRRLDEIEKNRKEKK